MQEFGTEFLYQTMPTRIAKTEDGRLKVGKEGRKEGGREQESKGGRGGKMGRRGGQGRKKSAHQGITIDLSSLSPLPPSLPPSRPR
jgi:hypothetical protein